MACNNSGGEIRGVKWGGDDGALLIGAPFFRQPFCWKNNNKPCLLSENQRLPLHNSYNTKEYYFVIAPWRKVKLFFMFSLYAKMDCSH